MPDRIAIVSREQHVNPTQEIRNVNMIRRILVLQLPLGEEILDLGAKAECCVGAATGNSGMVRN
jgi:hypothetical protein